MSLNYDLSKIADRKTVCWGDDGYMRPVTESIIFASMSTNVSPITAENASDFFDRYQTFNAVFGFKDFFTLADVVAHVGLSTNVNNLSSPAWLRDRYSLFVQRKADDDARAIHFQTEA